jgi:hypothetical protein
VLTVLVVVVGAHLVHGVDGVADGAVELCALAVAQAVGRERLEAGDEVGPRLRVDDPEM